jgi:prepilin peptidase CpaA
VGFLLALEEFMHLCLQLGLVLLVVASAVHDLASRRIPNALLLLALLLALPLQAAAGNLANCLLGALTGFLLFLPLYMLRGMAAGDVKLMASVGALVGPAAAFETAVLTWCVGGVMALAVLLVRGRLGAAWANLRALLRLMLWRLAGAPGTELVLPAPSAGSLPYGVAIAVAALWVAWQHG